ncbi:MAG: ATP-binding protein [Bacteroidetes bacterium]|nr:ATP-binding protein [Bacteroidota bacterium]
MGKLPRKQKKNLNGLFIDISELENWEIRTQELINEITQFTDQKIQDNFSLFHDIIPTISLIFRTLESLINKVDGDTFEKKVENADYKLRTLYHAIDLLENRLKIMPLIGNPESAKFGQVTKCYPYKMFDKVCRLFTETANRKNVKLNLHSDDYVTAESMVYDSFMTLPFLLIENAIKYSKNNNTVDIYIQQINETIKITVSSFGPIVKKENIHKIFEKGFKDPNAQKFSSKGSGIGLYLADIVAKAHNIIISYKCKNEGIIENEIEMGTNKFSIILNL